MKFFDLHCDTLFEALEKNKSLNYDKFHISIDKGKKFSEWIQCFAVFIPDYYRDVKALDLFFRAKKKLDLEISKKNSEILLCSTKEDLTNNDYSCKAILTVEGGAVLAGDLSNLDCLHKNGVKMMTLTWNGRNEIGDGCGVSSPKKITEFGKHVLKKMELLNMIVDVSHSSDQLFYDVFENTSKPFVASHSNSRKICTNRRNLTDDQFSIIKSRSGLIGINFCKDFLNDKDLPSKYDIVKHVDHFLSLGGEKIVSIGADFDGADMPYDILGIQSIEDLYELFLKEGYKESLLDKIFFYNAYNFFINNCFL